MIKRQIYIRKISPSQRAQLEAIGKENKLKTGPDIVFFILEKYPEQKLEIERLKRIIELKQKKIERLQESS
ncbi:MAG: hypothetical protein EOO20_05390 [Chryseobacterium sp.]|nr:MAG: hypothetical protein EOO20_05390 [Chryseobacterium sp.]